jgi:hypothetical protein
MCRPPSPMVESASPEVSSGQFQSANVYGAALLLACAKCSVLPDYKGTLGSHHWMPGLGLKNPQCLRA